MKTEKATPHRLQEQGKKGKSFNSKDALIWLLLFNGAMVLCFATSLEPVADLFRVLVSRGFAIPPMAFARMAAMAALQVIAPLFASCVTCIFLVSLAQSRGVLAFGALSPDLSKLNPVTGFKNMFSVRIVKDLVRSCIYLVLTALAASAIWRQWSGTILNLSFLPATNVGKIWVYVLSQASPIFLLWLLPVALLAAFAELLIFLRDMKMDKNELKQERKSQEGNPEIKSQHKRLREELSNQVKSDIAGSSVILANPTHIAVGLWLRSETMPLPFITLREKGDRALAIIRYAERIGVPVVRDIPLARGLYARTRRYGFVSGDDLEPVIRLIEWLMDVERAGADAPH